MSDIDDILAKAQPNQPELSQPAVVRKAPILWNPDTRAFEFADLEGAYRLAQFYLHSGAVPDTTIKDARSPQEALSRVAVIIEAGKALGVQPRAALAGITVIRGKLTMWGDLLSAIAQNHPQWGGIEFIYAGELSKGDRCCTVTVHRKGCPPLDHSFSQADAKRAKLSGQVWDSYPDRMLFNRARAFALRDQFADALAGMSVREEFELMGSDESVAAANDVLKQLQ